MVKVDTKEELMACARELIQQYGVNAVSYADLSKIIGISKASIHHHFPRKDDLILALIEKSRYVPQIQEIVESRISSLDKLRAVAAMYEQGVCNNKMCLIGILSTEYATLSDDIRKALVERGEEIVALLEKIIRQGMAEEVIKEYADSRDIASAFHSTMLGAQILSRCSGKHDGFNRAIEVFIESIAK